MRWPERLVLATVGVLAGAGSALAVDPGRLDLLAAEAARLVATPAPSHALPASWMGLAPLYVATMLAAFLGTYAGARRQILRGGKDWRELTYRFRAGHPMQLKQDTLVRLSGLLGDLEGPGSLRKASEVGAIPAARPDPGGASGGPDGAPTPGDPRRARERARRLLDRGLDATTVREITGIRAEELDGLRAAPAGARR